MPDLQLSNIEISFGTRHFAYDFRISGSRIVAVSGKSGAGKSTLFHLIAGFETPQTGRIFIDGLDVTAQSPGKRPLTYIFQEHNLFAHLDVFDNAALGISPGLRLSSEEKRSVLAALEKVGLEGYAQRRVQDLSGGERQRVAFARALLRRRPLLLLDEAFASLDDDLRISLGALLQELQKDNDLLVLMITHDKREIQRLAQEVLVIDDGRVVFQGTIEDWQTFAV